MRFETLGRRIAAAPRAIVLGLVALTLALTPGAVRVRVAPASPGAPELASFALTCESGVWSLECLANVDELTRALANAPALVARVDSLATRRQVVVEDGALRLRPLIAERPADPDELRRLRARAVADPAAIARAGGCRARARLWFAPSSATPLRRTTFTPWSRRCARASRDRREVSLAVVARAWGERELARDCAARPRALAARDPRRLGIARGARARERARRSCSSRRSPASPRSGARACRALVGLDLGAGAAALSSAIAATAAAGALALAHRLRSERRGARGDADAVARALASLGVPLGAAALAGAAAFARSRVRGRRRDRAHSRSARAAASPARPCSC